MSIVLINMETRLEFVWLESKNISKEQLLSLSGLMNLTIQISVRFYRILN